MLRSAIFAAGVLTALACGPATAEELGALDLSGEWYVLLTYKDQRSQDASVTRWKDFAWSIQQRPKQIVWLVNPYVVFDQGTEVTRRYKIHAHNEPWQPEGRVLSRLSEHLDVSARAEKVERLKGSREKGYRSLPQSGLGSARTMTFTRDWTVSFSDERVRITVTDSLGGSELLGDMEESTVYEITQRVSPSELRGTYVEGPKSGTLRMLRSAERRVVK